MEWVYLVHMWDIFSLQIMHLWNTYGVKHRKRFNIEVLNQNINRRISHRLVLKNNSSVFFFSGELCEGIVPVPLYLSQLRVSIVTCIKGTSVQKSKPFRRDLYRKCSLISYAGNFGNPGDISITTFQIQ